MEKKPNWLVRHIKKITFTVSIYPWIIIALILDCYQHSISGYAAIGEVVAIFFLSIILSVLNLIISSIIIISAKKSKPPLAKGSPTYFLAMNSISASWIILMLLWQ
ncbi:hypothetical protein ACV822_002171 [Klebsiella aerogenes]|uniref:hypothetical protein n=1 Tax=Klebsiella aerogenes TaxID=548 RepID=UPI0027F15CD1|nr:hypothetical protein [Klebsiella aerogenes]